jgi:hypothetical protein
MHILSLSPSLLISFTDNQDLYWVYFNMFSQPAVWFCILLAITAAIIPDILAKAIENLIERNEVNKLQKIETDRQQNNVSYGNIIKETKLPNNRKNRKISNISPLDPRFSNQSFNNTRKASTNNIDSVS